jgi:hypothetical protein
MSRSSWACRSPLIYLSFYLELPFDVGLTEGQALRKIHLTEGPLEEWDDLDLDDLLGMERYEVPGTFPCTTFQFRRATVVGPGKGAFAAAAFPQVFRSSPPDSRVSRTVVRAIRIASHETGEFDTGWVRGQFDAALALLGDFLVVLGEGAEDLRIGPVTPLELPSEIHGMKADFRDGLPLDWRPFTLRTFRDQPADGLKLPNGAIERALGMVPEPGEPRPLLPAFEMAAIARRSLFAGRLRHAVLESGTAIELLLYGAVHVLGHGEEWSPERFRNILGVSFKNLVMHHVAPQFGFSAEPASASDALGRWWRDGYELRNRVAHEGHHPTKQEVVASLAAASALDHDLMLALSSHPKTREGFPFHLLSADSNSRNVDGSRAPPG